jgi:CheY-like chemotaxis protein
LAVDSLLGSWQTILVVDDVPEQREIAVGILKRLRYYPLTAASGEAAVELLKKREGAPIDAVLLDMVMPPGMDGLDTYREILKLAPNIKALIASGFPETERVKKALELGVGAYIKKPYMILEIGLVLKKILTGAAFIKLSTGKNNPKSRAF